MSRHKRKLTSQEDNAESGRPEKKVRIKQPQTNTTHGDSNVQLNASESKASELKTSEHNVLETASDIPKQSSRRKGKFKGGEKRTQQGTPKKLVDLETWTVSKAAGGHFQLDPVFSADGQRILLAHESSIGVYHANSTALQMHTLHTRKDRHITGFALASDDTHLYISTISGVIELWDWTQGERLAEWKTQSQISSLTTAQHDNPDSKYDTVYTIDMESRNKWSLMVRRPRIEKMASHTLYESQDPLTHCNVVDNGRVVVLSAGHRLIIGITNEPDLLNLEDVSYTWRETTSPEWIASLDVKVLSRTIPKAEMNKVPSVNVVVGGLKGALFSYQDILGNLTRKESNHISIASFVQKLHWHRQAVSSVKWSLDYNYIISGGMETVIVVWQLDTGKKQFLPHLSAAIESIVVSPLGTSYAIRLANNSVKVLSTTELQPIFSLSGIQISHEKNFLFKPPKVRSVTVLHQGNLAVTTRFPATVTSGHGYLLLAAPAASSRSRIGLPQDMNAAFLQTVDVKSGWQISNQALARTKVTTLNMGPESNLIEGPNVKLLQISHNDQWLATVDEWTPPMLDVESLAINVEASMMEQKLRMEVFLKFWEWNDDTKNWELISRIDGPHSAKQSTSRVGGSVLDLIADQSSVGFLTIGEDWSVKIWKPKPRKRNGVEIRNKKSNKLYWNWVCQLSISLPINIKLQNTAIARLAISKDGSLLTAAHDSLVHMIDPVNGSIVSTRTNLLFGRLKGLGIIHRYLVLLSEELVVWDLVNDEMHYSLTLDTDIVGSKGDTKTAQLAISQSTFVVAAASQLTIFDPSSSNCINQKLPQNVKVLLPLAQGKGYLAIDALGEIRVITPQPPAVSPQKEIVQDQQRTTAGLENLLNHAQTTSFGVAPSKDELSMDSDHTPVVRQHQLTEIFDRPTSELPSMTELFQEVAKLFSKKEKSK